MDKIKSIVEKCSSWAELGRELGYSYCNGKVVTKLKKIVEENNLNIDHFDCGRKKRSKVATLYPKIKKNCPVCGDVFETQDGHPREKTTCSFSCSNKFFR